MRETEYNITRNISAVSRFPAFDTGSFSVVNHKFITFNMTLNKKNMFLALNNAALTLGCFVNYTINNSFPKSR